ncbi:hypothetical protein HMPREF7215_0218 [Pyramidobacter piscolens W5455]|uniref:Uncharacterized protein n=1 Tax=Pyramidobacter piscolens W5455 TaxID=352165 RepID=A0ABM9ZRN1_9BACT|nr:hypothetical protein HMPREF7215_0218 [Pyramidobacter piscolens W5455]
MPAANINALHFSGRVILSSFQKIVGWCARQLSRFIFSW